MYRCNDIPPSITVAQAHQLLQLHRDCHYTCPTRRTAVDVLEASGRYRLATRFG
jgi:hypothetical protein